jgi:hypothetical protein
MTRIWYVQSVAATFCSQKEIKNSLHKKAIHNLNVALLVEQKEMLVAIAVVATV